MKTKQEVIQEAWGEYWDKAKPYVDENGWVYGNFEFEHSVELELEGYDVIRPKSLQGIETNNHWISIDGNIKVDNGKYWVRLFNPDTNIESFEVINVLHGVIDYYFATHYQPIIKPQAPIY